MITARFKPSLNAPPLRHKGKFILDVTYTKLDDGTIWVYETDHRTETTEPIDPQHSWETIMNFITNIGWVQTITIDEQKQEVKCECGAAYTSNPNLHSQIMPCPLYRRGA
jgi:hypothetical protein